MIKTATATLKDTPTPTSATYQDPDRDCALCPRLCAFRMENRAKYPDKHNAPVPSFGALDAELLIVGLGPGLKGANWSGRPFTGDYAGDVLYPVLIETGYATGTYGATYGEFSGDDLQLKNCRVTNAVRCVPPENKPLPVETKACNPFLKAEINAMRAQNLKTIIVLGRVAHEATCRALGIKPASVPFGHAASYTITPPLSAAAAASATASHTPPSPLRLVSSYHVSRYNVNTGRMSARMFRDIINYSQV